MTSKVASMRDAVADLVRDGDTVAIEGFTHLISFAAGHEIIRQRQRDLTLARLTPDVIYDQMIAGGVASKLVFSWLGNPGVGGLGAIRRRIEGDAPATSRSRSRSTATSGWSGAIRPGAMNLPFFPLRSLLRDRPAGGQPADPADRLAVRRRDGLRGAAAQAGRHDRPRPARLGRRRHPGLGPARLPEGGGLRGRSGDRRRRGGRRRRTVIRADPNRTIIPGLIVDAVVVEPWGAHPSYVQGAYDRDNRFYLDWDPITRDEDAVQAWLREWVYDLDGRAAYIEKLGAERLAASSPARAIRLGRLRGVPMSERLLILVTGPYRPRPTASARIAANVEAMPGLSLPLYRQRHRRHEEWFALPLIDTTSPGGRARPGPEIR